MQVEQYVYLGKDNTNNTLSLNDMIGFTNGAYRIAFQALPGTKFIYSGENYGNNNANSQEQEDTQEESNEQQEDTQEESNEEQGDTLIMGPTGIYEIGFQEPLIYSFKVCSMVDPQSIMILDVLASEGSNSTENIISNVNVLDSLFEEQNYENR